MGTAELIGSCIVYYFFSLHAGKLNNKSYMYRLKTSYANLETDQEKLAVIVAVDTNYFVVSTLLNFNNLYTTIATLIITVDRSKFSNNS